jgi:hypothetical protein
MRRVHHRLLLTIRCGSRGYRTSVLAGLLDATPAVLD